jgi:hypothetical protein
MLRITVEEFEYAESTVGPRQVKVKDEVNKRQVFEFVCEASEAVENMRVLLRGVTG